MEEIIVKILDDVNKHFIVYLFLLLAFIFGIILRQGITGLALFCFATGVLIGQEMP